MKWPAPSSFTELERIVSDRGLPAALAWLSEQFRERREYAEWFEILRLQARHVVGLPLLPGDADDTEDPSTRAALERRLFEACGTVGEQLFREGRPADGWKYYQLVGDRPTAARWLREIPPTDDNIGELIDVALLAGVDPQLGIELTLRHRGTCAGITRIDEAAARWTLATRDAAAAILVAHVYRELANNLAREISRRETSPPAPGLDLAAMSDGRPWLFADRTYQFDPSHLAATVRLARMTSRMSALEQAYRLAVYGLRLDAEIVPAGDPPFEDVFAGHERYFRAAMGRDVDEVLAYFSARLDRETSQAPAQSTAAVLVDLCCRRGRWTEALTWSLRWLDGEPDQQGLVRSALDIARYGGELQRLSDWYRERGDLLRYGVTLLQARAQ
jgi:hypothetical protein